MSFPFVFSLHVQRWQELLVNAIGPAEKLPWEDKVVSAIKNLRVGSYPTED
jgi:hypothetical protein